MGKKPGGAGGGWLATVRKVFKTSPSSSPSKDKKVCTFDLASWHL
jgi:hypothetical protein